jgi:thiazole synthase ThiGH ThiG subunit
LNNNWPNKIELMSEEKFFTEDNYEDEKKLNDKLEIAENIIKTGLNTLPYINSDMIEIINKIMKKEVIVSEKCKEIFDVNIYKFSYDYLKIE